MKAGQDRQNENKSSHFIFEYSRRDGGGNGTASVSDHSW
jgi:hypothetical protein